MIGGKEMGMGYKLQAFGYEAEVVPRYGMNCIRFADQNGTEVLRTPEDIEILGEDNAFLYGMPVLFFPNRLSGGKFTFEGREYRLPMNEPELNNYCHGDLHKLPFVVTEYDDEHIVGVFEATEDKPYMTFPHAFTLQLEYRLKEDGLYQVATMKNNSTENMPFALAFHTTFCIPFAKDGSYADVRLCMETADEIERNMANYMPTGVRLPKHEFQDAFSNGSFIPGNHIISRLYEMKSPCLELLDVKKRVKISYIYDEKYKYCMMFNGGNKEFFCLEPQTWLTNCPNISKDWEKDGFLSIAPCNEIALECVLRVSI